MSHICACNTVFATPLCLSNTLTNFSQNGCIFVRVFVLSGYVRISTFETFQTVHFYQNEYEKLCFSSVRIKKKEKWKKWRKKKHILNDVMAVTIDKVLLYVNQGVAAKAYEFRHTNLNQPSLNRTTGC